MFNFQFQNSSICFTLHPDLVIHVSEAGVDDVESLEVGEVGGHEHVGLEAGHLRPGQVEHLGVRVHWLRDTRVHQS